MESRRQLQMEEAAAVAGFPGIFGGNTFKKLPISTNVPDTTTNGSSDGTTRINHPLDGYPRPDEDPN